ncbi:MAG: TRAP transporter substrate-binding protein DctP [Eubacterium sp.]|nr:TRAP transporter substrate-binding protein DctP [Eubacterium sp.]
MKRMKLLSLILVGAMSVSMLAACGSSGGDAASGDSASGGAAATADAAPAASADSTGDSASGLQTYDVDAMEISFSTTYQETETGGQIIQYFIDTLSDTTNGAITVNMNWGGTLYDTSGELDGVASGGVDMVALGHMPHTDVLNYLTFPGFAPGGTQAALDYFNDLLFDNADTSALIQAEAEEVGIKYLNVIAGGANAFCASYEFTDLDSLISGSSTFGNMDAAMFEDLGFQVTALAPPDTYDGLQRGLIDSTQMALAPMVAMSWQEVASYWALDGTYTAGNMFTYNLAKWNSLTADQQAAIQQAADATEDYSAGLYDDAIAADMQTVVDATGHEFVEFSDEDVARIWAACFEAKADAAIETCEANGKGDGIITILEEAAKITGYDWSAE